MVFGMNPVFIVQMTAWLHSNIRRIFVVLLTDRIWIQLLETKGNSVSMIPELPGGLNQAKLVV